ALRFSFLLSASARECASCCSCYCTKKLGTFVVLILTEFEEIVERAAEIIRAFEICEVATVLHRHQLRVWKSLSDVVRNLQRKEVVVASDNECRNPEAPYSRDQIISIHLPRIEHESILDRARLNDSR